MRLRIESMTLKNILRSITAKSSDSVLERTYNDLPPPTLKTFKIINVKENTVTMEDRGIH